MRSAHSPSIIICRGHTFGVTGVAWSPDGTRLASASTDGTARLWDANTGQALGLVGTPQNWPIHTIAWSRDGRYIALGDEQGYLQVAGEQGSIVHAVQPFVHPPHLGSIRSVAWSPNRGDALASGSASG